MTRDAAVAALPGSAGSDRARRGVIEAAWPVVAAFVGFVGAWKAIVVVSGLPLFILPPPELVAARFVDGLGRRHDRAPRLDHARRGAARVRRRRRQSAWSSATPWRAGASSSGLLSPYLVAAQAVPILALAPLLALWFGPGLLAKVVICGLIVFFPVAIATMVGIRSVDRGLLELGRSLRADPPPGRDHDRDPGRAAVDPRRAPGRRDARRRRRDRRRVGRRRPWPRASSSTSPAAACSTSRCCSRPSSRSPCWDRALCRRRPRRAPPRRPSMIQPLEPQESPVPDSSPFASPSRLSPRSPRSSPRAARPARRPCQPGRPGRPGRRRRVPRASPVLRARPPS